MNAKMMEKVVMDRIESKIVDLISRIDLQDPNIRDQDETDAALLLTEMMRNHYDLFRKNEKLLKSYMIALIVIFRARHSDFFTEIGFDVDKDEISSLFFGLFENDCYAVDV